MNNNPWVLSRYTSEFRHDCLNVPIVEPTMNSPDGNVTLEQVHAGRGDEVNWVPSL